MLFNAGECVGAPQRLQRHNNTKAIKGLSEVCSGLARAAHKQTHFFFSLCGINSICLNGRPGACLSLRIMGDEIKDKCALHCSQEKTS